VVDMQLAAGDRVLGAALVSKPRGGAGGGGAAGGGRRGVGVQLLVLTRTEVVSFQLA
ncbi:hypothetical protein MNEG_8950, partial [Monoraphidium neglectum]